MSLCRNINTRRDLRKGVALIVCMFFVVIFTALAVAMASMSGANLQLASNQHHANMALAAAQSGIECGRYLIANANTNTDATTKFLSTGNNTVSSSDATDTWTKLCKYIHNYPPAGKTVSADPNSFTDAHGSGKQLVVPAINFVGSATPNVDPSFALRFYRYTSAGSDANTIKIESTGSQGGASKKITIGMKIQKSNSVMHYAISSKARVWITGNSTIHGDIYSSWKYQSLSPFNMTSDSKVLGTINTILTKSGADVYAGGSKMPYDLETLASTSNPEFTVSGVYDGSGHAVSKVSGACTPALDSSGNRVYDSAGNPVYNVTGVTTLSGQTVYDNKGNPISASQGNKVFTTSPTTDEIQGQSDGINYNINYGDNATNMPGMDLADYDTSSYKSQTTAPADSTIYNYNKDSHGNPTTAKTVTEYFPNAIDSSGNPLYGTASSSGSLKLTRYVCQNKTLTNLRVGVNKNALFQNCTFNGILYVDNASGSNDVRFENCTFNGPIVTTPSTDTSSGWWQRNQLYFTGTETFQNQTNVPATILAPNYNVNIGNTDPTDHDNNVLTGAIVGGIVDIRGNAQVYGTIISMFDTSGYNSGYVSNIGATTKDGGSETLAVGDAGTINITPNPAQLLPSGITTPIVIVTQPSTYTETN